MCKSKEEGGGRCEYADTIANVRRKAKYLHREKYYPSQEAEKVVRAWKEENQEFVMAHLPETQPFQVPPNRKPIPEKLKSLLVKKSREEVMGLPKEERISLTTQLFEDNKKWAKTLTEDESDIMRRYAMTYYELVNSVLRRTGLAQLRKENRIFKGDLSEVKEKTALLDSAIAKAPKPNEPRKLFRYFQVPDGVTSEEYMRRYFKEGESFKDRGYMSTSVDPEFITALVDGEKEKKGNFIVMEIITKQGASLQNEKVGRSGDIQSLENEILLPRNMKLRIAGVRKSQRFAFADDRQDLYSQFGGPDRYLSDSGYQRWGKYKKDDKINLSIIQLVDEALIS